MELLTLIDNGTPVLVLGMFVMLDRINTKVQTIQEDVADVKRGITWRDTCEQRENRIARLEQQMNGARRAD